MIKFSSLAASVVLFLLTGCNQSDESVNTDYSMLKRSTVKDSPLSNVSNHDFSHYVKNGIRLRLIDQRFTIALAEAASTSGQSNSSNFSTTNVHEIGVDEADRIKYDGEYLYQVNQPTFQSDANNINNDIRILKTDTVNATVEQVGKIVNESSDVLVSDIFLRTETQQLISQKNTQYYSWDTALVESDWSWNNGKVEIQIYDIQTPEAPLEQWKIEIEGNLEGSRRVGNMLYLVTRYVPNNGSINYSATSDEEKIANEKIILNTPISDLLPHYQTNDGAIRSLVQAQDCLIAEAQDENEGFADIITFSAIDLDAQQVLSATCLNANVQGIYSSASGFYIGGSEISSWFDFSSFTAIHKFDISAGSIEYKASTSLPGTLGWSDSSFRMSENQGDLRIVTSYRNSNFSFEHRLSILRDDGSNQLQLVSTLPNETNPAAIGKPGEDIFAVRFTENRAYIVTFQQVDPLYVIDLSQAESPMIAGELEIPGFSRYLHPLSDDWLLGIGNEVINGRTEGVKVELFDLRDMSNPLVKNKLVFGENNSYTEASFDLRSISLLEIDQQQIRLAFPIEVAEKQTSSSFGQWKEGGLFLFGINSDNNNETTLSFAGKMSVETVNQNQSYPLNSGMGRSKLHDNAIFYLRGNQFYSTLWGNWESLNGPF